MPNAYYVWIERLHKVAITSDVWFDETLMPWRPPGDRRVAPPPPHHAQSDDQPPGLPDAEPPPSGTPNTTEGLTAAYDSATRKEPVSARGSTTVLLMFSGPKNRPDGLATFLNQMGYSTVLLDNDPSTGGGAREDILDDQVYADLLARAKNGEFLCIIAAPPCSTFSIARFIQPKNGSKGAKQVRSRSHIAGLPGLGPVAQRQVQEANAIVNRTVAIILAAHLTGTEYIIENPSDRGDPSDADVYLHSDHGPVWLMPAVIALARTTGGKTATFPMCAFDSPWQKFTSLLYSPGFTSWVSPLTRLRCLHHRHDAPAGGEVDGDGNWVSSKAAAYPASFNLYLAKSVASLVDHALSPHDVPASEDGRGAKPADDADPRTVEDKQPVPRAIPTDSSPVKRLDFEAVEHEKVATPAEPPIVTAPMGAKGGKPPRQPKVYARGAGRQATRSTAPTLAPGLALLCLSGPWREVTPALLAAPGADDPRSRKEAMARDQAGWTASEDAELENHRANGSWEWMDRTEFEKTGRKLVKTVWVYKVKRNGKLKSRLCVQGCSQIPGVDYDQTHCGTMRSSTLRLLASTATQLNLRMRRWDFVAAYLQGELLEGEVVYCHAPPGHPRIGADGREQVLKVLKPIYGMAQAGRRWQRTLYPWMSAWGKENKVAFERSFADSNVFIRRGTVNTPRGPREETLIVGVYVDDCFVLYSHNDEFSLYHKFVTDLQARWQVDDEGEVSDLLGVEITHHADAGVVELTQTAYIEKLAAKWFPNGVPATTQSNKTPADALLPQLVADALVLDDARDPEAIRAYQSLVGALLYASTNTRPDIAYAVGMLCRAMVKPTPELQSAALRVLGYLYRTKHLGLRYRADSQPARGYSDSDWAVKHSTSGFVFMYNSAAVNWGSKKQASVALSSCEAEIMAASLAASEAVHLRGFLQELGLAGDEPMELGVDNTAARDISYNPERHQTVKHIERRHFFIRECVENLKLTVPYVNTVDNLADFFVFPHARSHECRGGIT